MNEEEVARLTKRLDDQQAALKDLVNVVRQVARVLDDQDRGARSAMGMHGVGSFLDDLEQRLQRDR